MPSKVVLISWDVPSDKNWLAEDNIALALHAYCPNTKFNVYPEDSIAIVDDAAQQERAAVCTCATDDPELFREFGHAANCPLGR